MILDFFKNGRTGRRRKESALSLEENNRIKLKNVLYAAAELIRPATYPEQSTKAIFWLIQMLTDSITLNNAVTLVEEPRCLDKFPNSVLRNLFFEPIPRMEQDYRLSERIHNDEFRTLKREGEVKTSPGSCHQVFDFSKIYSYLQFDGVDYIFTEKDLVAGKAKSFEFGCLFEIGRMLKENNIVFKNIEQQDKEVREKQ